MAEKNKDIDVLVKMQKQRPAFSRMISWEFSQTANTPSTKKRKQKKKRGSSSLTDCMKNTEDAPLDDEEGNSSESSDYETAPEDEVELLEMSGKWSSSIATDTTFDSLDSLTIDDVWRINNEAVTEEDDEDEDENDEDENLEASGGGLHPGRRRRPSKKQKRKRSKYFRVTYANDIMPLGNICDMTNDIDSVFSDVKGNDLKIQRRVPSLAELCMMSIRRKPTSKYVQKKTSSSEIPTGIKKLISNWRYTHRELGNQLSFLQNYILAAASDKTEIFTYLIYFENDLKKIKFPRRSVWCPFSYPVGKNASTDSISHPNQKAASFLFVPSLHKIAETESCDSQYYMNYAVELPSIMSAFATTIDLMLPSFVKQQRGKQPNITDSDLVNNQTAIVRVKRALNLRFPGLVKALFEQVLPYSMWARGNVTIATEMFRDLISKENKCRNRAMYLSEIARMHGHFGDDTTCDRFYRLASETSVEEVKGSVRDISIDEVTEQTQVLLASVADMGLLTTEKAQNSNRYWSTATKLPRPKKQTILAHIESYLCFHAAHWEGQDWLCEAVSRIQGCVKNNPYLHHHLSMIHALQGDQKASSDDIRNYRATNFHLPGSQILSYLGHKARNPWQPLVDIVANNRTPIMPLNVVWRAKLQSPRLSSHRPMEADVNSRALNLHINDSGHLTGDMQMLLPPIREVAFDPYTGSLVLNNIPSYTGSWKSVVFPPEDFHCENLTLPTPSLIYSHSDGTMVHLVKPTNENINKNIHNLHRLSCPMVCYWRGSDGQTAKLNLFTELKNYYHEKTLSEIKEKYAGEQKCSVLCEFLQFAYCRNYSYSTLRDLESALRKCEIAQKAKEKKAAKKGKQETVQNKKTTKNKPMCGYFTQNNYWFTLLREPFVFGKTVVLYLKCLYNHNLFLVFINTDDRASFLKCKLVPCWDVTWVDQCTLGNSTDLNFFMIQNKTELQFYNPFGMMVEALSTRRNKGYRSSIPHSSVSKCCIVEPKVYGLNAEQNSVWCHILGIENDEDVDLTMTSTWAIAPYWNELATKHEKKQIEDLKVVGKNVGGSGNLLFVHLTVGVGFMDPVTMEFVKINLKESCQCPYRLNEDHKIMVGRFNNIKYLTEKSFTEDSYAVYRLAVGVENKLIVFEISHNFPGGGLEVSVVVSLSLPGIVKEACFVGKDGLILSLTQHIDEEKNYSEHVFHFNMDGHLCGVVLCLGQGPRSFHPAYLYGDTDNSQHQAGWYVYMRDGHDGILGVRLQ